MGSVHGASVCGWMQGLICLPSLYVVAPATVLEPRTDRQTCWSAEPQGFSGLVMSLPYLPGAWLSMGGEPTVRGAVRVFPGSGDEPRALALSSVPSPRSPFIGTRSHCVVPAGPDLTGSPGTGASASPAGLGTRPWGGRQRHPGSYPRCAVPCAKAPSGIREGSQSWAQKPRVGVGQGLPCWAAGHPHQATLLTGKGGDRPSREPHVCLLRTPCPEAAMVYRVGTRP